MTRIARFAAAFAVLLACSLSSAAPALADPYRVKDLSVDVTAGATEEAITQGRTQARQMGAERLIRRLTLPEDRARAKQQPDPGALSRLYSSFDSQTEKRTTTRYIATLTYNFDAKAVREYLDGLGLPFVDTQAGLAMIAPTTGAGVNPADWTGVWRGKSDNTVLTPYVVSSQAWDHQPTSVEVQQEANGLNALRTVVTEAYNQDGQYYVRLTDLRAGSADTPMGAVGPFSDLAAAQAGAVEAMETAWKQQTIVRSTNSNVVSLVAYFHDIGQWQKIRKGIESSRMITGLKVESVSTAGADLSFNFAGRPDQLAADLRARGLKLSGSDRGYTLETLSQ